MTPNGPSQEKIPKLPESYRPITLLSSLSKIFEKVIPANPENLLEELDQNKPPLDKIIPLYSN